MTVPTYIPPTIARYTGTQTKLIVTMGDSLAYMSSDFLQWFLSTTGRNSTVINGGVGGSGPAMGGLVPDDWNKYITALADACVAYGVNFVYTHFGGNSQIAAGAYGSQAWKDANVAGTLNIIDVLQSRNIKTYWSLTPAVIWLCDPNAVETTGLAWYRNWQHNTLINLRPASSKLVYVDWSPVFTPGGVYTDQLLVNGLAQSVRAIDCVHPSTPLGQIIAYRMVANATKGEWV